MNYLIFKAALGALFSCSAAQFNLYPPVDPSLLAKAYGLSQGCVEALNETLSSCDPTLFQMAISFDNYFWEDDNITDVCDGNCTLQARDWDLGVSLACSDEWISAYGKLIPADSISGRFVDGLNTVCLGSTTDDRWCLGASQNWTGADVIQPDCNSNPSDPSCTSNITIPEYTRIANLYPDDNLCDNCFIQLLYARVVSPFLADSDQSDFLVSQLQDIGDVCNVTIPDITVRALPSYAQAPSLTSIHFGATTTSTTSAPKTSMTCKGQLIASGSGCAALSTKYGVATGDLQKLSGSDTCAITSSTCFPAACTLKTVPTSTTCDSLAASLNGNITTVQLLLWNRNIQGLCDSLTAGQSVCISAPGVIGTYSLAPPPLGTDADAGNQQRGGPGGVITPTTTASSTGSSVSTPSPTQDGLETSCNNYALVHSGDNCVDFAKAHNILPAQLYAWNPVLGLNGADCPIKFWVGEFYCIGATATVPLPPPGPAQTGITASCKKYALALAGDTCSVFASRNSISNSQLFAWNGVLGASGQNCQTSLWGGEWYCVGIASGAPIVTTTSITSHVTTSSSSTASHVATTSSTSKTSHVTTSSSSTTSHVATTSITSTTSRATTSSSSTTPHVATTSSTSTTSHVTAPGPTQTGISRNCITFALAISGDSCDSFAARNHITNTNLYAWNSILGSTGQNCATSLLAQEWYCVAVSGGSSSAGLTITPTKTTSTTAKTTSHVTAPGPTQTGISKNCNKYAAAVPGDSCDTFAKRNGITNASLFAWNTILGTNGGNCGTSLWAQEYYCVGISL